MARHGRATARMEFLKRENRKRQNAGGKQIARRKKNGEKQLFLYFVSFSADIPFECSGPSRIYIHSTFFNQPNCHCTSSLSVASVSCALAHKILDNLLLFFHIISLFVMGHCQCVLCLRNVLLKSSFVEYMNIKYFTVGWRPSTRQTARNKKHERMRSKASRKEN